MDIPMDISMDIHIHGKPGDVAAIKSRFIHIISLSSEYGSCIFIMRNVENLWRGLQLMCRGNEHAQTHWQTERQTDRDGDGERESCCADVVLVKLDERCQWRTIFFGLVAVSDTENAITLSNGMPALGQTELVMLVSSCKRVRRPTCVELYLFDMRPAVQNWQPSERRYHSRARINTSEIEHKVEKHRWLSCVLPQFSTVRSLHWKWHYESATMSQTDDSL